MSTLIIVQMKKIRSKREQSQDSLFLTYNCGNLNQKRIAVYIHQPVLVYSVWLDVLLLRQAQIRMDVNPCYRMQIMINSYGSFRSISLIQYARVIYFASILVLASFIFSNTAFAAPSIKDSNLQVNIPTFYSLKFCVFTIINNNKC